MTNRMWLQSKYSLDQEDDGFHIHACFSAFPSEAVAREFAAHLRTAVEKMCARNYANPDYAPAPEAIQ